MANAEQNLIEFRGVSWRSNGGSEAAIIDDVSLEVARGKTLVLLGRSGSGKTTLLKLINGMHWPSKGQVLVEGRATREWDAIRLRRGIGYVIQEAGLFPHFTVAELVGLVPGEFAQRKPRELSGGQRQRVGVARALAADPPILLMDEPFGALDPVTRAELQREFRALASRLGKSIVFVTHDVREALFLGARIVLLAAGRLVGEYAPKEFLHSTEPEARAFAASFHLGRDLEEAV